MAIRIITGVPGAGKTYYAVKHLRDNYYKKDRGSDTWEYSSECVVITNITELKLPHINLNDILEENKIPLETFFTVQYQEKIKEKYPKIVYFLDECQNYFPYGYKNRNVLYLFEYHRHLGIDFYLITQSINLLPRGIRELYEQEIRAISRSVSFFGEFKYSVRSNGHVLDTKMIKKDKSIFNLYKSMDGKENEKVNNPLKKYIVGSVIFFVLALWFFISSWFGGSLYGSEEKREKKKKVTQKLTIMKEKPKPVERPEPIKLKRRKLNYVVVGDNLHILDPEIGSLVPLKNYRGGRIEVVFSNGRLVRVIEYYKPEVWNDADDNRQDLSGVTKSRKRVRFGQSGRS